jgi:hypothetical protein
MTTVISTARDALAIFTGRIPPNCAAAEARLGKRRHQVFARLRATGRWLGAHVLDLLADEIGHRRHHDDGRVLGRHDFAGRRIGRRGDQFGITARARLLCLELGVADVVAMRVRKQDRVQRAEPRVVAARHRLTRVVDDAHAGWVFEDHGAIARTQLASMRAQRRDLDVLRGDRCSADRERQQDHAQGQACLHRSSRK